MATGHQVLLSYSVHFITPAISFQHAMPACRDQSYSFHNSHRDRFVRERCELQSRPTRLTELDAGLQWVVTSVFSRARTFCQQADSHYVRPSQDASCAHAKLLFMCVRCGCLFRHP